MPGLSTAAPANSKEDAMNNKEEMSMGRIINGRFISLAAYRKMSWLDKVLADPERIKRGVQSAAFLVFLFVVGFLLLHGVTE
jgi:hypothetical protein